MTNTVSFAPGASASSVIDQAVAQQTNGYVLMGDLTTDAQLLAEIRRAIETLPPAQRQVVTLRDVEGLPAAEVCEILELAPGNQRVLLHRGRFRVRQLINEARQ